jgi:predicted metalloendopeptidase
MAKVALTKEIMDARSKAGSKYMQGEKEQRDEIQKTIDLMKRKAAAEAKGFTVGFEDHAKTRIANLDREIDKLRERQEMDELDIAGKRQLAKALKEEYDWKLNLGEEEKKIRALKVESAKLMKEAEADETKAQAEKKRRMKKPSRPPSRKTWTTSPAKKRRIRWG